MWLWSFYYPSLEPVPVRSASNPYAVQRPHATANLLERQGSFRGFEKLQETSSPFKRTLSLRLNELPSTLQRQSAVLESPLQNGNGGRSSSLSNLIISQSLVKYICYTEILRPLSATNKRNSYHSNISATKITSIMHINCLFNSRVEFIFQNSAKIDTQSLFL